MGARHIDNLAKHLAAAAKGRYALVREVRYDHHGQSEYERQDGRFQLVNRAGVEEASFTAGSLPGCCGVLLIHSFKGAKAKHIADFIGIAVRAAKAARYGALTFTLQSRSKVLDLYPLDDGQVRKIFVNGKTGNPIVSVFIDLHAAPPAPRALRNSEGE